MRRVAASALLAWSLGCAAERAVDPERASPSPARVRAEVLDRQLAAQPADAAAAVERAALAAFLDRDDARAQALLARVGGEGPQRVDAALLACELVAAARDYPRLIATCAEVLQRAPASPQAELAASALLLAMDQTRDGDARVVDALGRARADCAAQPGPGRCAGIALASARASLTAAAQRKDAAAYQALLDGVAAVRRWRVCPGLAPASVEQFRATREALRDGPVVDGACRARRSVEPSLRLGTADPLAPMVVEAWVHAPRPTAAALLWQLPDAARAIVDGMVVVDRDPWRHRDPDSALVALDLDAGWHHLRVVTWPRGADAAVSLWALDAVGGPALDAWQAEPPATAERGRAQLVAPPAHAAVWLARDLDPLREPWRAVRLVGAWTGDLLEDGERARALAQRLVAAYPDSGAAWFALAEAARVDPTLPGPARQRETRRALASVLEHRPRHLIARYRLALLDVDERPELALAAMQALAADAPGYAWAQRRLHAMLWQQDQPVAALQALEAALELAPGEASLADAATFLARQGAIVRAHAARDARLTLSTTLFDTRRSDALAEAGDLSGALAALDAAYALAPDQPGLDAHLRLALQVEGWTGVQQRAARRLETFPLDLAAARWLVRASRQVGGLDAALATAERVRPGLPAWWLERERARGLDLDRHLPVDAEAELAAFRAQAAASPGRHAGHASVYILDAAARVLTAQGGGARITHQLILVQSKDAASQLGEVRPPPGAELRTLRVHKPDGRIVEPEPAHASGEVSLSSVVAGDVIELRWIEERAPDSVDGAVLERFFFASRVPVLHSRFVVGGPTAEVDTLVLGGRGAPPPNRREAEGFCWLEFDARDVSAYRPQPFSPPMAETLPHLTVHRGVDVALWTRRAARRLAAGEASSLDLEAFARAAVRGLSDDEQRLRALVQAVVQRVREPGPELDPVSTLATGRGDRQALLRAAGRLVGLDLRWAALHRASPLPPEDWVDAGLDERFLIARLGSRQVPLALAGRSVLVGALFAYARDGTWLEVDPAGSPPPGPPHPVPDAWLHAEPARMEIDAALDPRGALDGRFAMTVQPPLAGFLRQRLRTLNPDDTARAIEGWFGQLFPGAALADFALEALDDDLQPLGLRARFTVAAYARPRAGALVVDRFLPSLALVLGGEGVAPASYLRVAQRTVPIVIAPHLEHSRVRLRLPAGASLRELPATLDENGPRGRYRQQARREGDVLVVERELVVPATRVAVDDEPRLRELARRIEAGVASQLVISLAPGAP